jgi:ornithine decarboxylase/arginine decarboxylase
MEYARRFKVLVCVPAFDKTDLEGARLREILSEVERLGYAVVRAQDTDDAELVVRTDSAIGSVIIDWGKKGLQGRATALISLVRNRGLDVPIILLVRRRRLAPSRCWTTWTGSCSSPRRRPNSSPRHWSPACANTPIP